MALTAAQVREHIGAMLQYGINNSELSAELKLNFYDIIKWAKAYRVNGSLGTQADRTEAMKAALRFVYNRLTGLDADTNIHFYKVHFLENFLPGEGSIYE
jgi:hypothetical protein